MAKKSPTPSETTPIVRPEARTSDALTFLSLIRATGTGHWISVCCSLVSCAVCVREGYAEYAVFDPLIFKSIFVVFGFAIGFRNVRANSRRSAALNSIRGLTHSVWDILVMIPDETREGIREQMLDACDAIAEHVTIIASQRGYHVALAGLEPMSGVDEEGGLRLGPNALVAATLLTCEDEIDRLSSENTKTQKYRRTFWTKKLLFDKEYAAICELAIPSVSDGYVLLINFCLFLFAVVLPWGISSSAITVRGTHLLSSGSFLLMNTMVVLVILLGLNTLASEIEDPFKDSAEKIDIKGIFKVFSSAVREYDSRRRSALEHKNDLVALHRVLCDIDREGLPLM